MGQRHPTLPITITPRNSRAYIHTECGQGTVISEEDFDRITNPFGLTLGTYCAGCGGISSLDYVRWEETGETVSDYRSRLSSIFPAWLMWLPYWLALVAGLIAAIIGLFNRGNTPFENYVLLTYFCVGIIAGLVLGFVVRSIMCSQMIGAPWTHVD